MLEEGKTYYFIAHAYHHFIGRVVKILGRRECLITDVRRVYSCARGWTEFFRDGANSDTVLTSWPDTNLSGWVSHTEWKHKIPEAK
jgi:hypothetical protein